MPDVESNLLLFAAPTALAYAVARRLISGETFKIVYGIYTIGVAITAAILTPNITCISMLLLLAMNQAVTLIATEL